MKNTLVPFLKYTVSYTNDLYMFFLMWLWVSFPNISSLAIIFYECAVYKYTIWRTKTLIIGNPPYICFLGARRRMNSSQRPSIKIYILFTSFCFTIIILKMDYIELLLHYQRVIDDCMYNVYCLFWHILTLHKWRCNSVILWKFD